MMEFTNHPYVEHGLLWNIPALHMHISGGKGSIVKLCLLSTNTDLVAPPPISNNTEATPTFYEGTVDAQFCKT